MAKSNQGQPPLLPLQTRTWKTSYANSETVRDATLGPFGFAGARTAAEFVFHALDECAAKRIATEGRLLQFRFKKLICAVIMFYQSWAVACP